ncbi:MAG: glycosyltransferase [Limisphaerales bacterium]
MRVLHVIPSVSPKRGGPSQAVLAMVRALREAGVGAEIAVTNDDGEGVLDVPLGERIEHGGVPVRFFRRFSPPFRPVREFAYSGPLARWLDAAVSGYDLLHVHGVFSFASTRAMWAARSGRVPYVNRPLGQLCGWSLQQRAFKKRAYLALAERANLDTAAAIQYMTPAEQGEAACLGLRAPGFVVPHGIELPQLQSDARARLRSELHLGPDENVVLFLSRLHPKKGLEVLIPALALIKDVPFTFVLAGSSDPPDYQTEIERLLRETGMTARTKRVGFVSGEWKQVLLQGADVFALTSHSENFGLAVVEALAARLPVVVTPGVALADEVTRHQVGEVVPMEVRPIAEAITGLLRQRATRLRMGLSAREMVERHYAWPAVAARITAEYQRILGSPRPTVADLSPIGGTG